MPKNLFTDYDGFVEKFKQKKTTDDCYTPVPVYDAILQWVRENAQVDLSKANIVRPFYPNGDYEAVEYGENDVVMDNPPFSILSKIVRFYESRNIRYFLFAPHLTIFNCRRAKTYIIADTGIIYENGAVVNTGFVSNLFGDAGVIVSPTLHQAIAVANKKPTVSLPKYTYPANVLTSTMPICQAGSEFIIPRKAMLGISALQSQKKANKTIFGGGFLMSDDCARAFKERQAQAQAQARIEWRLSDQERAVIEMLNDATRRG